LFQFITGDPRIKAAKEKNAESTALLNILERKAIRIESSAAGPSNGTAAAPACESLMSIC